MIDTLPPTSANITKVAALLDSMRIERGRLKETLSGLEKAGKIPPTCSLDRLTDDYAASGYTSQLLKAKYQL